MNCLAPVMPVCCSSFRSCVGPKGNPRQKFSKDEDTRLTHLVSQYGANNWHLIAEHMQTRSARQCRERYMNYLAPNVRNGKWTSEEEVLLVQKFEEYGPKWTHIAESFPGRSSVNVKNQWAVMSGKMARAIQTLATFQCQSKPSSVCLPSGRQPAPRKLVEPKLPCERTGASSSADIDDEFSYIYSDEELAFDDEPWEEYGVNDILALS